ncbi:MAG: hypothetical protein IT198_07610 [Acidimicrobiia bacterium]|nr:hypothetical protein [Acidimicrobiia bacterium]
MSDRAAETEVTFDADLVDRLAAREHQTYVLLTGRPGPAYADLSEDEKELNRESVRAIPDKLRHVGLRAVWVNAAHEEPLELTPAEVETLACAEHDRWIEHTVGRGYTWGPDRDDDAVPPTHPDLVPYEPMSGDERRARYTPAVAARLGPGQLGEAAREKDRARVRNLPAILGRTGIGLRRLSR